MEKPKSKYARKLIASWKEFDEDEFDNLLFIEKAVTVGMGGFGGNMKWGSMKDNMEAGGDIESIWKELNPKGWKNHKRRVKYEEERDRKEEKEFDALEKKEMKEKKDVWQKIRKDVKRYNHTITNTK